MYFLSLKWYDIIFTLYLESFIIDFANVYKENTPILKNKLDPRIKKIWPEKHLKIYHNSPDTFTHHAFSHHDYFKFE